MNTSHKKECLVDMFDSDLAAYINLMLGRNDKALDVSQMSKENMQVICDMMLTQGHPNDMSMNTCMTGNLSPVTGDLNCTKKRVCGIISHMRYDALVRRGVIPDLAAICPSVKTRRFPKWVYINKMMTDFGMYCDFLVRKCLAQAIESVGGSVDHGPHPSPLSVGTGDDVDIAWSQFTSSSTHFKDMLEYLNTLTSVCNFRPVPSSEFVPIVKKGWVFYKDVLAKFAPHVGIAPSSAYGADGTTLQFGVELSSIPTDNNPEGNILGHPDIIGSGMYLSPSTSDHLTEDRSKAVHTHYVIDIKTSSGFKSIREKSFLQILAYAALMRSSGVKVDLVGIYLPMQCQLMWFDITGFDLSRYLEEMLYLARPAPSPLQRQFEYKKYLLPLNNLGIGSHFSRGGTIEDSSYSGSGLGKAKRKLSLVEAICRYAECFGQAPGQLFIYSHMGRGGHSGNNDNAAPPAIGKEEYAVAKAYIETNNLSIFVHAPHSINLSNPFTSQNKTSDTYIISLLSNNLIKGNEMGASGVVVHVGKSVNHTLTHALDRMEKSIRAVLPYASEKCPLLLETPAAEGTETLTTPEEFLTFYNRFSAEEQKIFRVCIDTCHIFAAGHKPSEYLQFWLQKKPAAIALIHFNDSMDTLGSCRDRHARIGSGMIEPRELYEVAIACSARGIPMLNE